MASYIPFVNVKNDCRLLFRHYPNPAIVRISLASNIDDFISELHKKNINIWLDPGIDIFHNWPPYQDKLEVYYSGFSNANSIGDPTFHNKPDKDIVYRFVVEILNKSLTYKPKWLTVPQLPININVSKKLIDKRRNRINRELAKATARWKVENEFWGKLILPIILTHQDLSNKKTNRNEIIRLVSTCYENSVADGIWVVEQTLRDFSGSDTLGRTRIPGIIDLHSELNMELPKRSISIAGPYWGTNLILWARGLITYPAIGLGRGYQYFFPGVRPYLAKTRIALPPLKRLVLIDGMSNWLSNALANRDKSTNEYKEFNNILRKIQSYWDSDLARSQIAAFYKEWLEKIESVPVAGRSLALYQELSNAYVIGKAISLKLPRSESPATPPEKVVQQFMLNCL